MGTNEILAKSSEESLREEVKVETPSPLTSSNSSAADSSKSLLNRINDLVVQRRPISNTDRKLHRESLEEEFISGFINIREESNKREVNSASSVGTSSSSSSPSSLRQRIRDFPTSGGSNIYCGSLAALDRRIRRERDVYLQLQGLNDRIDEKDEGEANSDEISTITKPRKGVRGRSRAATMCSSAPETMRVEKMNYTQRHFASKINDSPMRGRSKKVDEPRPSECQRSTEQPSRKIIRSNAPPLCLTDEKILRLLRRGSVSAREDNVKRGTDRSLGKLAARGKPTGLIIESLTSGSENEANEVRATDQPFTNITEPEKTKYRRGNIPVGHSRIDKTADENLMTSIRDPTTNGAHRLKLCGDSSENSESRASRDRFPGGGSQTDEVSTERGSRRNVVRSKEKNTEENHRSIVPKLDVKSQEYSRSTSIASCEKATKMPLDVDELLRALSDVSIKRQIDRQMAWADRNFPISIAAETDRKIDTKNRDCRNWMEASKIVNSRSTESAISSENSPGKLKIDTSIKRRRSRRREKNIETRNNFRSMDRLRSIGTTEDEDREVKPPEETTIGNYGDEVRQRSIISGGKEHERREQRRNDDATAGVRARGSRSTEQERVASNGSLAPRRNDSKEKIGCSRSPRKSRFDIYEDSFESESNAAPICVNRSTTSSPLVQSKGSKKKIGVETQSRSHVEETNIRSRDSCLQTRSTSRSTAKRRLSRNLSTVENTSSEPSNRELPTSRDSQSQESPERSDVLAGSFSYKFASSRNPSKLSKDAIDSIVATASTNVEDVSDHEQTATEENLPRDLPSGGKENVLANEAREVSSSRTVAERLSRARVRDTGVCTKDEARRASRCKFSITDEFERGTRGERPCTERISASLSKLQLSSWKGESATRDRSPFVIINDETSTRFITEMTGKPETIYRSNFVGPAYEFGFSMPQTTIANDLPNGDSRYVARWEKSAAAGPSIPRIRNFFDKFQRWRKRRKTKTREDPSNAPTTRILYENNECRVEQISSRSVTMTNDGRSNAAINRDRDGLWVVGFETENKMTDNGGYGRIDDCAAARNVDGPTACQPEVDAERGCSCARICRFLIGRSERPAYRLLADKP